MRSLRRTSVPVISGGGPRAAIAPGKILAGILAVRSAWRASFQTKIAGALSQLGPEEQLDFGCALQQGTFECKTGSKSGGVRALHFSAPEEALIFFVIRLMERLRCLAQLRQPTSCSMAAPWRRCVHSKMRHSESESQKHKGPTC